MTEGECFGVAHPRLPIRSAYINIFPEVLICILYIFIFLCGLKCDDMYGTVGGIADRFNHTAYDGRGMLWGSAQWLPIPAAWIKSFIMVSILFLIFFMWLEVQCYVWPARLTTFTTWHVTKREWYGVAYPRLPILSAYIKFFPDVPICFLYIFMFLVWLEV